MTLNKSSAQIVYKDSAMELSFDPNKCLLLYGNNRYGFVYYPDYGVTVITKNDFKPVSSIKNFDARRECERLLEGEKVVTESACSYDTKAFCELLLTSVLSEADWTVEALEKEFAIRMAHSEVEDICKIDGCVFGRYIGQTGEKDAPFDVARFYVRIDNINYDLYLNGDTLEMIMKYDNKTFSTYIRRFSGSIESYCENSEKTVRLCRMLAYAVRRGKNEYDFDEIEKAADSLFFTKVDNTDISVAQIGQTLELVNYFNPSQVIRIRCFNYDLSCYRKDNTEFLNRIIACALRGKKNEYLFGDLAKCPEVVNPSKMIKIEYDRESVCAADDYEKRDVTISLPENAVLEDLIQFIKKERYGHYSLIPYIGGHSLWTLQSDKGDLARVSDGDDEVDYLVFSKDTPLKKLGVTKVFGRR